MTVLPRALISRYTRDLGWPLLLREHGVYLPANLGVLGLKVATDLAGEVGIEIRRREVVVPIVSLAHHWMFLTEEFSPLKRVLPPGVEVANGPVPLPPTEVDGHLARWISAPTTHVPPTAIVLSAIRHVLRRR